MTESSSAPANNVSMKNKLILLAILAMFILPFVILPLIMSPEKLQKTNKGFLIQPHVLFADLHATDINNRPVNISALNSKWTLLYVMPSNCNDSCVSARTNALYSMRQVRLSLDRDADRVQQLLLFTVKPDQELTDILEKEFSNMLQMHADGEVVDKQIAHASSAGNIYLMSPDGYIFIYYPPYEIGKDSIAHADDIRSDLKKSIQGSRL